MLSSEQIYGYRSGYVTVITYVLGQSLTLCYGVTVVEGLITAYIVTVPELDEIEQQLNVRACALSWVSSLHCVTALP